MKKIYRIEVEKFEYTYRSYQACEDQGSDDCVGEGTRFVVFKGNRRLKSFNLYDQAKKHLSSLKRKYK